MIKNKRTLLLVIAFWLIVSPWILGFSELNIVLWNNVAVSVVLFIIFLWSFDKEE